MFPLNCTLEKLIGTPPATQSWSYESDRFDSELCYSRILYVARRCTKIPIQRDVTQRSSNYVPQITQECIQRTLHERESSSISLPALLWQTDGCLINSTSNYSVTWIWYTYSSSEKFIMMFLFEWYSKKLFLPKIEWLTIYKVSSCLIFWLYKRTIFNLHIPNALSSSPTK